MCKPDLLQEFIYCPKQSTMSLLCRYCNAPTVYVDSAEVYRRSYGMIYLCRPCEAWVGVHKGTDTPLGEVANAELRTWRKKAHAAFAPLWRAKMKREGCSKSVARRKGYQWLSEQLDLPLDNTHIAMFDVDLCKRVVALCEPFYGR